MHVLDLARKMGDLKQFIYFSTDEVFGPAGPGMAYAEWDRYDSTNPYAATKAGGEELALAYANTYGIPVLVTHTMNLYGERQHPEKFIPLVIRRVLEGREVTIHADHTLKNPGSRFYIHCRNMASAILFLLEKKQFARDKMNIVGQQEINNLVLAEMIASMMGKPLLAQLVDFHSSRPGHDLRYALNGERLNTMGWRPPLSLEESLSKTIDWTLANLDWLYWDKEKEHA
jgi:dTDP-glucose 4,6-dehydratase